MNLGKLVECVEGLVKHRFPDYLFDESLSTPFVRTVIDETCRRVGKEPYQLVDWWNSEGYPHKGSLNYFLNGHFMYPFFREIQKMTIEKYGDKNE